MKIVQTIHIGTFTINSIGGSSIVQIGSSGMIQAHSESYETKEVAPVQTQQPGAQGVQGAAGGLPAPNGVEVEIPEGGNGVPEAPRHNTPDI